MTILNTIKSFLTTKVNSAVKNSLSKEEQYQRAATIIIDKVHDLKCADANSTAEIARLERLIKDHLLAAKTTTEEIKILKNECRIIPDSKYVIALQHTKIAESFKAKILDLKATSENIAIKTVELGDKLDVIKSDLQMIRMTKETNELGIQIPEDVNLSSDLALADVDKLMSEVDTFIGGTNSISVNSSDLEVFKNSFK